MGRSLSFERAGECLYRNPSSGTYYAVVKLRGKQFKAGFKTDNFHVARRKLKDYRNDLEHIDTKRGKITKTETTYYFDDIPVLTYSTKPLSASHPFWFLINYAIGGISGWKIDLNRYGNSSDMWVDYVRVYQGN